MSFYKKHLFFCNNQRAEGKKCCFDADARSICAYAKKKLKALGLGGKGGIRVSSAGCLGRCKLGPCLLIYPQGIWYTYASIDDIDEIIEQYIVNNKPVTRLLIDAADKEDST